MYIHEVVDIAYKRTSYIRRRSFPEGIRIIPTNDEACCIVLTESGLIAPRWNPTAEDLTADDWIVTGDPTEAEAMP